MQELEKILEEIDRKVEEYMEIDFSDEYNTGIIDMTETAKTIIRKHMDDGWIPVEEYAPEDGQLVLCCDDENVYLVEYQADWDAPFGDMDDIIAWRPLPEPYRPKKESEGSRRLRERKEFFKE